MLPFCVRTRNRLRIIAHTPPRFSRARGWCRDRSDRLNSATIGTPVRTRSVDILRRPDKIVVELMFYLRSAIG